MFGLVIWIGELTGQVYKLNPKDQEAEDLAITYAQDLNYSRVTLASFFKRRGIEAWAIFHPANTPPEEVPYSTLSITICNSRILFYKNIAPFGPANFFPV